MVRARAACRHTCRAPRSTARSLWASCAFRPPQMKHFSADEDGILPLSAFFFASQSLVVFYAWRVALRLMKTDLFHRTVQVRAEADQTDRA